MGPVLFNLAGALFNLCLGVAGIVAYGLRRIVGTTVNHAASFIKTLVAESL